MMWRWLGTRANVELGLTWRSDRVTRGRGRWLARVARDEAWRWAESLGGACDVGMQQFLCSWVRREKIYPVVVVVFWSEAWSKKSDEGNESLAMDSTDDDSGHTRILMAATEQYQRWLRQRKNARKDEELHKTLRAMALIPCLEQWLWYHA